MVWILVAVSAVPNVFAQSLLPGYRVQDWDIQFLLQNSLFKDLIACLKWHIFFKFY